METKTIKIAPDLDEITREGNTLVTHLDKVEIRYHMDKNYYPDAECFKALQFAIAMASREHHITNHMRIMGIEGHAEVTPIDNNK